MLPKTQRLSVKQFDAVMKEGRVIHSPFFLLRIASNKEKTGLSTTVPVKVVKTAAGRNRLRRKMYEAVAPFIPILKDGVWIVVFAKSPAIEADLGALTAGLEEIFVKAGLLK